jgi:hypothetical protein
VIQAIAIKSGYTTSAVSSAAYTIEYPAATPIFNVSAGTYNSIQTVSISDATTGVTIYYTTNGTAPTTSSTVYSTPITVSSSETIEAIAAGNGYSVSPVATAVYTITLPAATPTFSPGQGTYSSVQTVNIIDTTSGTTIYYTIDGTAPTTSSTVYSGAITVSATETLEAIATAGGYSTSAVATAAYTIIPPAGTPTFSVPAGAYATAQVVTISDTTPSSTIFYTTNGTTPTTSSTVYSGSITVPSSETIEAIATASNYSTSTAASAGYFITPLAVSGKLEWTWMGGSSTLVSCGVRPAGSIRHVRCSWSRKHPRRSRGSCELDRQRRQSLALWGFGRRCHREFRLSQRSLGIQSFQERMGLDGRKQHPKLHWAILFSTRSVRHVRCSWSRKHPWRALWRFDLD